jgi:hypothetical protein
MTEVGFSLRTLNIFTSCEKIKVNDNGGDIFYYRCAGLHRFMGS